MLGSDYCKAHTLHDFLSDGTRRAAKKGNFLEALAYGAGAVLTDSFQRHDLAQKALLIYHMRQQQIEARAKQQQAAAASQASDPFKVLRLDPNTATEKDVRRVQRALAELYHDDKAGSGVDAEAMAEVNAAAQAAIKAIKAR